MKSIEEKCLIIQVELMLEALTTDVAPKLKFKVLLVLTRWRPHLCQFNKA